MININLLNNLWKTFHTYIKNKGETMNIGTFLKFIMHMKTLPKKYNRNELGLQPLSGSNEITKPALSNSQKKLLGQGERRFFYDYFNKDISKDFKEVYNLGLRRPYIKQDITRTLVPIIDEVNFDNYVNLVEELPSTQGMTNITINKHLLDWMNKSQLLIYLFRGANDINPRVRNAFNQLRIFINKYNTIFTIMNEKSIKKKVKDILLSILFNYYSSSLLTLNGTCNNNTEDRIYTIHSFDNTLFLEAQCAFGELPCIDGYEMALIKPVHNKIYTITFYNIDNLPSYRIYSSTLSNKINSEKRIYTINNYKNNDKNNKYSFESKSYTAEEMRKEMIKEMRVYNNNEIVPYLKKVNYDKDKKNKIQVYTNHTLNSGDVKLLILNKCSFSTLDLSQYKNLTNLEEIRIKDNKKLVKIEGLHHFKLKKLKIINNVENRDLDEKLSKMRNITSQINEKNFVESFKIFNLNENYLIWQYSSMKENLTELVISNCGITTFPIELFQNVPKCPNLKKIDLSYNLIDNINADNFSNNIFDSLEIIDLSHNKIKTINNNFDFDQRYVQQKNFVLNLSYNEIKNFHIKKTSTDPLYQVSILLNNNKIDEVFFSSNILSLYYLDLSNNRLKKHIDLFTFNSIQYLNLSSNINITDIITSQPITDINYLDISMNNCKVDIEISKDKLAYVDLSYNQELKVNFTNNTDETEIGYLDISNNSKDSEINTKVKQNIDIFKCIGKNKIDYKIPEGGVVIKQLFYENNKNISYTKEENTDGSTISKSSPPWITSVIYMYLNTETTSHNLLYQGIEESIIQIKNLRCKYLKYDINIENSITSNSGSISITRRGARTDNSDTIEKMLYILDSLRSLELLRLKNYSIDNKIEIEGDFIVKVKYLFMDNVRYRQQLFPSKSILYIHNSEINCISTFFDCTDVFLNKCNFFRTQKITFKTTQNIGGIFGTNFRDTEDLVVIAEADTLLFTCCQNVYITNLEVREINAKDCSNLFVNCIQYQPNIHIKVEQRETIFDYFYLNELNRPIYTFLPPTSPSKPPIKLKQDPTEDLNRFFEIAFN